MFGRGCLVLLESAIARSLLQSSGSLSEAKWLEADLRRVSCAQRNCTSRAAYGVRKTCDKRQKWVVPARRNKQGLAARTQPHAYASPVAMGRNNPTPIRTCWDASNGRL